MQQRCRAVLPVVSSSHELVFCDNKEIDNNEIDNNNDSEVVLEVKLKNDTNNETDSGTEECSEEEWVRSKDHVEFVERFHQWIDSGYFICLL